MFAAAYEAAEEAVYNCLVAASAGTRLDGSPQEAFPAHLVRRACRELTKGGDRSWKD